MADQVIPDAVRKACGACHDPADHPHFPVESIRCSYPMACRCAAILAYGERVRAEERERVEEVLDFYADADTYFAVGFLFDHPCGEFETDFDEEHGRDYPRPMPGKRARAAIREGR